MYAALNTSISVIMIAFRYLISDTHCKVEHDSLLRSESLPSSRDVIHHPHGLYLVSSSSRLQRQFSSYTSFFSSKKSHSSTTDCQSIRAATVPAHGDCVKVSDMLSDRSQVSANSGEALPRTTCRPGSMLTSRQVGFRRTLLMTIVCYLAYLFTLARLASYREFLWGFGIIRRTPELQRRLSTGLLPTYTSSSSGDCLT